MPARFAQWGSALARVGLKDFDAAMVLSPAGEEQNTLENRNAYRPVSILYIRSRLVNPSSHQVRTGNCLSVGNICDSTPVPKILVNRISHHCPMKFGDIRGRANRKNGKYVARYRSGGRFGPFLNRCAPIVYHQPSI
jgi:hypothetical protein